MGRGSDSQALAALDEGSEGAKDIVKYASAFLFGFGEGGDGP